MLKKITSITIAVCGIAAVSVSYYIKQEVAQGEKKIASAEKKVSQGDTLFSLSPATKELGKGLMGSAQKKINEGKEEIAKYSSLAGWLQIGGILFVVLGIGGFFVLQKK